MSDTTYNYKDTVYIRNLNEKVKVNTIKSKLTELFKSYGPIISITAHKNIRMKGQAFVTLQSEEAATQAIQALNGTEIFQKKIEVDLAKSSSDPSVEKNIPDEEYQVYIKKRRQQKEEADQKKQNAPKKVKLDNAPPNKILLLQDLPTDIKKEELEGIFSKYEGFIELRLVAVRKVAFVEFEDEKYAIPAKEENQNMIIRDSKPSVNYAKK